jgi:hypothetical protein
MLHGSIEVTYVAGCMQMTCQYLNEWDAKARDQFRSDLFYDILKPSLIISWTGRNWTKISGFHFHYMLVCFILFPNIFPFLRLIMDFFIAQYYEFIGKKKWKMTRSLYPLWWLCNPMLHLETIQLVSSNAIKWASIWSGWRQYLYIKLCNLIYFSSIINTIFGHTLLLGLPLLN